MSPITGSGRPGFPKTLKEFIKLFPDDDACWRYRATLTLAGLAYAMLAMLSGG